MDEKLFGPFEGNYSFCVEMPSIEEKPGNIEKYRAFPLAKQQADVPQKSNHLLRLRGGALTKSPLAECEEVMEQFDKILREYRNALSPCGQIGCNFAPNIVEATCNQTCYNRLDTGNSTDGCGSPECEYAKYKSSLIPLDADIEKQFIGPAIIGNCGHPKCPYQMEPILPPIHWECPEALPAGKCTNPNCPYVPNDMVLKSRFPTTTGPCGSDECPYVPPAPCASPNCPFKTRPPCATAKEALLNRKERNQKQTNNYASCPFSNPPTIINVMQLCDNPNCDVLKRAIQSGDCTTRSELCNSPNCPVKSLRKKCSNPTCPFTKSDIDSACSNPDCPLNRRSSESCSNPNCPFTKSSTEKISELTQFSSDSTQVRSNVEDANAVATENEQMESCVNPECSFNAPSIESCKNPDCPFKEERLQESKESCDNPDCPFKQESKTSADSQESLCECENPLCPSKRETCLNPNCPFNLRGYETCRNPDCPHKKYAHGKDLGYCSTPSPSFNETCGDKTCPFYDAQKEEENELKVDGRKSLTKIGNLIIEKGALDVVAGDRPSRYDAAPCGLKTCRFMGGQLECTDCSVGTEVRRKGPCPKTCPGDPICPLATERKLRRTGKRHVPLFKRLAKQGQKPRIECSQVYPGYKIGHRECCVPYFFVPPKMGWLWNIHTPCLNLKPRRGWRPGAVTRTVAKAIIKHRKAQNDNPFENNQKKRRKRNDDSETKLICPKPTLEVKKREGAYFITMNPLKDPNTLQQNENPYMDVTPMQFKVAKNNALDPNCICTDEGEYYKSDSSSNSEFEIEVTTPAGIIHPERPIKKKEAAVKQTQYDRRDIPPAEGAAGGKRAKKGKKGKKKKKKKK